MCLNKQQMKYAVFRFIDLCFTAGPKTLCQIIGFPTECDQAFFFFANLFLSFLLN